MKRAPWELTEKRPRSISGVELDGDNLSRRVYLDESGISTKEKVTVVAGVIVNPDKQWKAIESCIQDLVNEYVPEEHREGFAFHATDLFHGSGKVFDRRWYPRERSREALKNLLALPLRLHIPVAYGLNCKADNKADMAKFEERYADHPRRIAAVYQAFTYALCAVGVQQYMSRFAEPNELAELLCENTEGASKAVRAVHALLKGKELSPAGDVDSLAFLKRLVSEHLPLTKIIDGVAFGAKEEAIPLQLADACAFIIRCLIEKKPAAWEFCEVFGYELGDLMPTDDAKAGWIILPFDGLVA
jgi:hypothetical protein